MIDSESEEAVFSDIHYLNGLRCTFLNYFPSATDDMLWVRNPFLVPEKSDTMSVQDYESLTDITTDLAMKQKCDQAPLNEF